MYRSFIFLLAVGWFKDEKTTDYKLVVFTGHSEKWSSPEWSGIEAYFESSISAVSWVSYEGMIEVIPTSSSVSFTSGVRLQRANFPPPSSVR